MSWAAHANPRAIDATPLAATKRAADGANGFFLDCSSPTAAASPRSSAGSTKASARRSSAPSPSPGKPSAAALAAQSQGQPVTFGVTVTSAAAAVGSPAPSPAKTLRPSAAALAAERPHSPSARSGVAGAAAAAAAAAPEGLPLHAQQSLRDEVALLKFEAGRWEAKLAEKDAALQKLSTALHDLQAAKLAEHARSRAQLAALRKQVVESDARLDFLRADLTQQKARECQAVARHNVQIAEEQNALLENVTNTIRASATAQVSPAALAAAASVGLVGATGLGASASAAGVGVGTAMLAASSGANSAASFHGAGTGLTHEEHLKGVLHSFAEERRRWDASRARELASVRQEAALRLEESNARAQSIKAHFASAYSKWKAQHAAQCAEIEGLAAYAAKLAYLLEEIDRGKYPVREKHGVRAFVIPAHKRKFLALDPALAEGGSGALGRRMDELRAALARAGIPWDPRDLGTDQSFLRDERQLQLRQMQQQLRLQPADDEGGDEEREESQPDPAVRGLLRSGRRSAEESKEQTGSHADDEPHSSSAGGDSESHAQAHTHLLEESLLDSLSSHPTVAYIAAVEAERDRYKHLLARETRRKIEMHETLTSQARLIDAGALLQRAGGAAAKESAGQLHHSSSANKARDILAASATMAISQQAGRLGVNVGYSSTAPAHTRAHSSGGELGITAGGAFNALGGGAVAALASPSRPITPYTTGGTGGNWSRGSAGVRPASAAVLSSPARAATGAHHKHSYSTASGFNFAADSHDSTRPTSAVSTGAGYAGRSGAVSRPGSAAWVAQQSQSSAATEPSAQQSAAGGVLSPAHYPKPTPLHITHGNASATLFAAQLAKKAHQQHHADQQHASTPSSGLSSALPTNRRGSGEFASNPASSRTPARSRAASAGRHRNIDP